MLTLAKNILVIEYFCCMKDVSVVLIIAVKKFLLISLMFLFSGVMSVGYEFLADNATTGKCHKIREQN